MSTYFETHPQKVKGGQWSRKRRNGAKPSGVVVVHTAESITDFMGPDPGAENVARYFCTTDRYASYHHLSDSDSSIQLAPWSAETWHDTGTNNHSVGLSAAIQCKDWDKLDDRGEKIVKRMAAGAASYAKWLKANRGIDIPARLITAKQARSKVPGFLGHGTSDPGRRSDPGPDFDWDLFFAEYTRLMGKKPPVNVKPAAKPKPAPASTKVWQNSKNTKAENIAIAKTLNAMGYFAGEPDGVPGTYLRDGVLAYQNAQTYFPGMKRDGDWYKMTQAHFEWTRDELQRNVKLWDASIRLGELREDGDLAKLTRKHIIAVMEANMSPGEPYYKAGGRKADGVPGPVFCKMMTMPEHPSA